MGRRLIFAAGFLLIVIFATGAYMLLRMPEEASAPIEAIPLNLEATVDATNERPLSEQPEQADVEQTGQEDAGAAARQSDAAGAADQGVTLFTISQSGTRVRFELDEDLRGIRNTVIGETDQVSGQIAADLSDLSSAQLGVVKVNARTLRTDNDFRNRAIANQILRTDSFEFITFTPTSIEGLSGSIAVGDTAAFTVVGDLTIRDTTQQVTFQLEVTLLSPTQISGVATTTVNRTDFGLSIPSVRDVANVEEEVELTLEFVADAG